MMTPILYATRPDDTEKSGDLDIGASTTEEQHFDRCCLPFLPWNVFSKTMQETTLDCFFEDYVGK